MTVDSEHFATVPLFDCLEPMEIVGLLDIAENLTIEPGQVVLREGETGDGFYVISSGAFEVTKGEGEGKVLARLEELSFFGEMSLVSRKPCTASVICRERARVKHFPVEKFEALLKAGNLSAYKVTYAMGRILADRLDRVNRRVVAGKCCSP